MQYSKFIFFQLSILCAVAQFSAKSRSWKDPVVKFFRLVLSVWSTTACCCLHLISPDGRLKRGCSLWFYGFLSQSHIFLFSFQWTDTFCPVMMWQVWLWSAVWLTLRNSWHWPVWRSGWDGVFYCPVNMAKVWMDSIGVKWYFSVCCALVDKAVVGCWMEKQTVVCVSWWDIHHVGLWEETWLLYTLTEDYEWTGMYIPQFNDEK